MTRWGSCSIGRRGVRRLTPYPGRGRATHIGPARDCVGRGERIQKGLEGIGCHFFHGDIEKAFVSRETKLLHGPWGHLIGRGRADARGGHGIVRLRRLTYRPCSLFFLFKGVSSLYRRF